MASGGKEPAAGIARVAAGRMAANKDMFSNSSVCSLCRSRHDILGMFPRAVNGYWDLLSNEIASKNCEELYWKARVAGCRRFGD